MPSFLNKRKISIRISLLAVLLGIFSLLGVFSAGAFLNRAWVLMPFWQIAPLKNIQPETGYAYIARTEHPELSSDIGPSPAQVLEDSHPLPGPADALHDNIRNLGKGKYSFWNESVYFSTPDNSDPNTNSRKYEIYYPLLVNTPIAYTLYFLTGLFWLLVFTAVVQNWNAQITLELDNLQTKLRHRLNITVNGVDNNLFPLLSAGMQSIFGSVSPLEANSRRIRSPERLRLKSMLVPAVVATIVPAYLLFTIPPTFNNTDAACYFSWELRMWIPQYQPGYLIFVRAVNNIISGNWRYLTFPGPVTTQALYTIIILQHFLTVIGIAYFASTLARSSFAKSAIALLISLLPVVFFYSHGIYQEAFLPSLILIMSASILRAYDGNGINKWLAISIGAVLYGMLLIRYDPVPLLLLPSCVFLLLALFTRNLQRHLKKAAYLFLTCAIAFILFYATSLTIEINTHTYNRPSTAGRRGVYLIAESPVQQNAQEKQKLIDEIKADKADTIEKASVEPIFNSSPAWVVHYSKVYEIVQTANPNWNSEAISNRTDEILNKIFYLYVKHGTKYYLSDIKKHFLYHLSSRPLTDLVWAMDDSIALFDYQQTAVPYEVLKDLPVFKDPQTKVLYRRTEKEGIWVDLYAKIPNYGTFFVIGFLLVILNAVFQQTRTHLFLISIPFLLFGLGHILFVSAVIIPLPRYYHIGVVLLFISLIILIINLTENTPLIIQSLLARQKPS